MRLRRWREFSYDEQYTVWRMRRIGRRSFVDHNVPGGPVYHPSDADELFSAFAQLTEPDAAYLGLESKQRSHNARGWKCKNVKDKYWEFADSKVRVRAGKQRSCQARHDSEELWRTGGKAPDASRDLFEDIEPQRLLEAPLCFCPALGELAAGVPGTVCETCLLWKAEYIGRLPPEVEQGRLSFQRAGGIPHVSPLIYTLSTREVGAARKFRVHFLRESDCDAAAGSMYDLEDAVLGGDGGGWRAREVDWRLVKWTVYGQPPRGPGICVLEPRGSTWVHRKLHALALSPRTIRRRVEPHHHAIEAVVAAFARGHVLPPAFERVEGEGVLEAIARRRRLKEERQAYEANLIPKLWLRGLGRPDTTL